MWTLTRRAWLSVTILTLGTAGHATLELLHKTPRPPLNSALAELPRQLGSWVGRDEPMDLDILDRTQADEYINRIYEDSNRPGRFIKLWINYSQHGLNLRHSPEVCLPSGGWTKLESQTRVLRVPRPDGSFAQFTRLGYTQADAIQGIGFWYYIFGEGPLEQLARKLPVSSRSSHGRTTRGSGLTVELFFPGEFDPDGETLVKFVSDLLDALEPMLPDERVAYHVP